MLVPRSLFSIYMPFVEMEKRNKKGVHVHSFNILYACLLGKYKNQQQHMYGREVEG